MPQLNEQLRLRIYQILVALQALVVGYNVVEPEQATLWVNLISAALGLGGATLAAANTKKKD